MVLCDCLGSLFDRHVSMYLRHVGRGYAVVPEIRAGRGVPRMFPRATDLGATATLQSPEWLPYDSPNALSA
jgi:hypothetical protein